MRAARTARGALPPVPLFTKPLAPGLGLAEDPGDRLSFGQSRCRIAAEGLVRAHAQGVTDTAGRVDLLAAGWL